MTQSSVTDAPSRDSPARPLYYAFSELPSRQDYPDYYKMIKKPISFTEVKAKLDARTFPVSQAEASQHADLLASVTTRRPVRLLADLRTDFNQIYVNAKRYNAPGSGIFLDAKKQHVRRLVPSASSFVHLLRN